MLNKRLKQLRLARGLSQEALAARMGGLVTKQSLSKYERGKAYPSQKVLLKLAQALDTKAMHLVSEPKFKVEILAFRSLASLSVRERGRIESLIKQELEERVRLQEFFFRENELDVPVNALRCNSLEEAEMQALVLREKWKLGIDPIANLTATLEDRFIHVLEITADEKFDGVSALVHENGQAIAAAVVTRRNVAGERQRLSLAHELGHLVLKVSRAVEKEKTAFRFGAAFLAPAEVIKKELGINRTHLRIEELLFLKQRFGLSMQALLYRLKDLRIITNSHYTRWCMRINKLGWKKKEPLESAPETPQWFRQNLLRALAEGLVSKRDVERVLGAVQDSKEPLSLVQRRAFVTLPIEERRRILAEQAQKLTDYYDRETGWRELEIGDFVEQY